MRTNFKKFFVVLFLIVISTVNAQFESNYDYFEEEQSTFGSLDDNQGFFSSGSVDDPTPWNPGDVIRYSSLEMGSSSDVAPIDDYILPIMIIGIGLGIYYRKQLVRS